MQAANGSALGVTPAADLLSLDDEVIVPVASATSAAAMLDELLAGPPPSQISGQGLGGGSADIMDLLAGPSPTTSYPPAPAQSQVRNMGLLGSRVLLGRDWASVEIPLLRT